MKRFFGFCPLFLLVVAVSVWIAWPDPTPADWSIAGWPSVDALANGEVARSLSAGTLMGPFATLVEAPFVALSSGEVLDAYRWASLPCLIALGMLGVYLASIARRRGASPLTQALLATLTLVNPLTFEALNNGHPEELLTAALAVGAIVTASEGHRGRTAVLLGLAIASKQWALIAVLPALMALPGQRLKVGLGAAVVAAALLLPKLVASPDTFMGNQRAAAHTPSAVAPLSVWYPLATETTERYSVGSKDLVAHLHNAPGVARKFAHPLIILLALLLPLLLALRRRTFRLAGPDAMALFALLALLRCALDPVDNLYYHLPLLTALIAWDALAIKGLPARALAGTGAALFFVSWSHHLEDVAAFGSVYLAAVSAACLLISLALFRPEGWVRIVGRTGWSRRLSYGSSAN